MQFHVAIIEKTSAAGTKYLSDIESRNRRTNAHPNSDKKPSQEHALKTLSCCTANNTFVSTQ